MSDINELKELIDSFVAYRNVLVPLQESLKSISDTFFSIRDDLDGMNKAFSGNAGAQLEKIHSTLNAQADSGRELTRKIEEFSVSGENYARSVDEMLKKFDEVGKRLATVNELEKNAENILSRLETVIAEKRASYNLKDLQKSLDSYNMNVEKISDFINKDVASVLQENAKKIEQIKKENELLSAAVNEQNKTVAELTLTFRETSSLLKKAAESGTVNEEYLFDAFDKWAADRKVKIKKK